MVELARHDHPGSAASTVRRLGPRLIAISERHSRFVGAMKLALPAVAAALIAIVLAWPSAFDGEPALELSFAAFQSGEDEALAMLRPRFLGTDAKGRPFTITAEVATQDAADQRRVTLRTIQADITLTDGSWITLIADGGVYHQGGRTLALTGPVGIHSDLGYEFHTGDVAVDLDAGTATSDEAVQGQGPLGRLRADAMVIRDSGDHLIFRNNVRVTLYPARRR